MFKNNFKNYSQCEFPIPLTAQTQKWMIQLAQQQMAQQSQQMGQQIIQASLKKNRITRWMMQKLNQERLQVAHLIQEKQQVALLKNGFNVTVFRDTEKSSESEATPFRNGEVVIHTTFGEGYQHQQVTIYLEEFSE